MDDKFKHIDFERLIALYLSGEASEDQVKMLEHWAASDPANAKLFLDTRKAFNLAKQVDLNQFDVENAWERVSGRTSESKQKGRGKTRSLTFNRSRMFQIAAAIIVLIGAILWIYLDFSNSGVEYLESNSLVLVEELPDGSTVSLNKYTQISYTQNENREVQLEGDAFFEVKRDEIYPFVVRAHDLEIRVLGTSFYVNAKPSSSDVEVVVNSGTVMVKYLNEKIILEKDERAIFNKRQNSLNRSDVKDLNYLAWKTQILVFDDRNLRDVVKTINEVYGSNIVLEDQQMNNCKITVTFKQQELEAILSIITETLDLTLRKDGSKIYFKGPGCK